MAQNTNNKKSSLKEDAFIYEKRLEDTISGKQRWKTMTGKERRTQFMDYYLQPLIISLFVIGALAFFIYHDFIAKKKTIYECAIVNEIILNEQLTSFSEDFTSFLGFHTDKEKATFGTYYLDSDLAAKVGVTPSTDLQHISVQVYAQTLDSMISDKDSFEMYNKTKLFLDLDNFLTEEEVTLLDEYLYRPEDKQLNPDHKPYGIYLDSSPTYTALLNKNTTSIERPILGVVSNSKEKEKTRRLLYFLFPNKLSSTV